MHMGIISRGFSGRRTPTDVKLPPGQYLTTDFPVVSAGPTPQIPLDQWELFIDDGKNVAMELEVVPRLAEREHDNRLALCHTVVEAGHILGGVSLDTLLADIPTDASHTLVCSYGDYTTNVPL